MLTSCVASIWGQWTCHIWPDAPFRVIKMVEREEIHAYWQSPPVEHQSNFYIGWFLPQTGRIEIPVRLLYFLGAPHIRFSEKVAILYRPLNNFLCYFGGAAVWLSECILFDGNNICISNKTQAVSESSPNKKMFFLFLPLRFIRFKAVACLLFQNLPYSKGFYPARARSVRAQRLERESRKGF